MTQFKEKVGKPARAGLGGALLLPGADGRRRARLQGGRGAGRRRPAPARRADAGDRAPLQRALRRDPGRARAPHPRGRRADHGPAGAGAEDVDDRRRPRRGRSSCSTSPTRSARSSAAPSPTRVARSRRGEDKAGITNLIDILAVARGVTPERDRGRVRRRRLRRLQGGGGRGRGRAAGPGPRALRRAAARRGGARGGARRRRREGARDRRRDARRGARADGLRRRARPSSFAAVTVGA